MCFWIYLYTISPTIKDKIVSFHKLVDKNIGKTWYLGMLRNLFFLLVFLDSPMHTDLDQNCMCSSMLHLPTNQQNQFFWVVFLFYFLSNQLITFWVNLLTNQPTNRRRSKHNLIVGGKHSGDTTLLILMMIDVCMREDVLDPQMCCISLSCRYQSACSSELVSQTCHLCQFSSKFHVIWVIIDKVKWNLKV